jgi:hypothetical protein
MSNRNWIQTLQGRKLEPLALTKDMVGSIEEIAHALSMKCRFTGQIRQFYSVAQHCCLGADLIAQPFKLAFLCHEFSETYAPDIASPLKPFVRVVRRERSNYCARKTCGHSRESASHEPAFFDADVPSHPFEEWEGGEATVPWVELEREHAHVMFDALNLRSIEPLIYSPEVKAMDLAMLAAEKQEFFKTEPEPWGLTVPPAPVKKICRWTPAFAKHAFLKRFARYTR